MEMTDTTGKQTSAFPVDGNCHTVFSVILSMRSNTSPLHGLRCLAGSSLLAATMLRWTFSQLS